MILDEIEVQKEIEVSTNLWIPPSCHIYSHSKNPGAHYLCVMGPEGSPFYTTMKRGGSGHGGKRAVIGHFQRARPVGK